MSTDLTDGVVVYEFKFDHTNENWSVTPEYSAIFLRGLENYFNELLRREGYVFLNEVLHKLGFSRIPIGQKVGWMLDDAPIRINFERDDTDGSWDIRLDPAGEIIDNI